MEGFVSTTMTARYRIEHVSAYRYDQSVTASFNVRLTPPRCRGRTRSSRRCESTRRRGHYRYIDYWGTQVRVFEAQQAHRELVVATSSTVEIDGARRLKAPPTYSWDDLRTVAVRDDLAEFLANSTTTAPPPELRTLVDETVAGLDAAQSALAVMRLVHDAMTYLPGSTGVHTLAGEAWGERSGVCQDYAIQLARCAGLGIPARRSPDTCTLKPSRWSTPSRSRATHGCSGG